MDSKFKGEFSNRKIKEGKKVKEKNKNNDFLEYESMYKHWKEKEENKYS